MYSIDALNVWNQCKTMVVLCSSIDLLLPFSCLSKTSNSETKLYKIYYSFINLIKEVKQQIIFKYKHIFF